MHGHLYRHARARTPHQHRRTVSKFASYQLEECRRLHKELDERVFAARHLRKK